MTTAVLDRIAQRQPQRIGQATAVEQSRAVAEVEAAVIVAQRMPRDITRAQQDMERSCAQRGLAERAFFRYSRGEGQITGPSVQLARELARCFGNVQYGLAELRRDDHHGQSEMLAFAWDVQTNTRSSTTFIVPHKRDKRGGPVQLTDMRDIYENNANNGARRLREMIFAILPGWYTEAAVTACYETLNGDEAELPDRIAKCIDGYGKRGVTQAQLEHKLGAPRSAWAAADLATLQVIWRSLMRGEISKDEEFPPEGNRVTAADITSQPKRAPRKTDGQPATPKMLADLDDLLKKLPLGPGEDREANERTILTWLAGDWTATRGQVATVTGQIEDFIRAAEGDLERAASDMWTRYSELHGEEAAMPDS